MVYWYINQYATYSLVCQAGGIRAAIILIEGGGNSRHSVITNHINRPVIHIKFFKEKIRCPLNDSGLFSLCLHSAH